jgi:hypothetical protein
MKTNLKFFVPTLLMFAFLAAFITSTATIIYAQTEDSAEVIADKKRLYEDCFLKDKAYASTDAAVKKTAMECGREYIKKYEKVDNGDAEKKAIVEYLKKKVTKYDDDTAAAKKAADEKAIYDRYDNAFKAAKTSKNWAEVFSAGKAVLELDPDDIDTMIDLASFGYDRTTEVPPNYTFSADAVSYAKMVIAKIEAGKESGTKNYGVYATYKTKTYTDGKNNALGWMNYIIGFIANNGKTTTDKTTVDSYYKAQKYTSQVTKFYNVYQAIGSWYLVEFNKVGTDIDAKIKAAGEKETDETKQLVLLQKGIADRAVEAYSRAYKNAKEASTNATATAASKDSNGKLAASSLKTITELYKFREDKKLPTTSEVEAYINKFLAKPFTEPNAAFIPATAPVVPVTPPTTMPTTKPTTTPTTMPAKPTTTPTTKPVMTPAKPTVPAKPIKKPTK